MKLKQVLKVIRKSNKNRLNVQIDLAEICKDLIIERNCNKLTNDDENMDRVCLHDDIEVYISYRLENDDVIFIKTWINPFIRYCGQWSDLEKEDESMYEIQIEEKGIEECFIVEKTGQVIKNFYNKSDLSLIESQLFNKFTIDIKAEI